jgi:hypothetical protein
MHILVILFWINAQGVVVETEFLGHVQAVHNCTELTQDDVKDTVSDYTANIAKGLTPRFVCGMAAIVGPNI